jgi:serine/threonine protein kinase
METSSPAHVHEIFDEAVELPPAQRADLLDQRCGGDRALRAVVEELLRANDQAGDFLAETVVAPSEFHPLPGLAIGSRVGPYLLQQILGQGGYGVVFLAEQEQPIKRKVALKVIKAGMDTQEVIRRFELERQALALMDHPNIARVLDAGSTQDGRPFFVMELVEGREIGRYCRENHLALRERLELFVQVCNAVQHAHQKGVIHRDLKPSNVLVAVHDGRGVPKVIDFGIAKALAESQIGAANVTQQSQFVGTPQYMSPEQVQWPKVDVDTRCDVYSLGVVLYELLTETPAFDPASLLSVAYAEMERIIREVDPPTPSARLTEAVPRNAPGTGRTAASSERRKIADQVRGELDWIVMKAMEKDRTRRYGTAEALAADIGRYLADEPVTAGAPGRLYRVGKFVRRHRPLIAAVLAVALAMGLGLAGTAAGLVRARAERNRAVAAQAAEEVQRGNAERAAAAARISEARAKANEAKAKAEAARMLAAQTFLFQLVAPPPGSAAAQVAPRAVLDYISEQAGSAWLGEHPDIEGPVRAGLGNAYKALGDLPVAQAQYHRAVAMFRKFEPDGWNLASTLHNEANTILVRNNYVDCVPLYRESLALYRKLIPGDDFHDAPVLDGLAVALANTGHFDEAIPLIRKAIAAFREHEGLHHPRALRSMGRLESILRAADRGAEADIVSREIEEAQSRPATRPG